MRTDKQIAVNWARNVLANKNEYAILDTETTGLHGAEMCEIAIIDLEGETLLDTLVKPTIEIPEDVIRIHGITNEEVENAPSFADIYNSLSLIFEKRKVLIYNAAFDTEIIKNSCESHGLNPPPLNEECLMEQYAVWYGDWSEYYGNYKWIKLRGGNHRAGGDCKAALNYLKEMARPEQDSGY